MAVGFPTILGVLLVAVNGLGWLLRHFYCPCDDPCACWALSVLHVGNSTSQKIDGCKEGSCQDVRDILRHSFTGSYILAAVLVVLYFCNEDFPCHENQTREHMYLSMVLGLIVSGSTLVWWDPSKYGTLLDYEQLQHFLLLIFALQIEQRMAAPERLSSFFDRRADSKGLFFERHRPELTTKAARVSARLAELETQGLRLGAGVLARISIQSFSWVMLFLFMMLQCMFQRHRLVGAIHYWLPYAWLAVGVFLAYEGCKKRFKADPIRNQIYSLVKTACDSDENVLRHLLWSNNVPTLLEVGGSGLIELLSDHPVLQDTRGIVEKAIFVDALMKMGLKWRRRQQATVKDIILGLHGKDATTFKNLIDSGGDYHNLYKLVFVDISSKQIRREIRRHLASQGQMLRKAGGKPRPVGIKILSDVDDTLHCSGGKWPAGCDKSLPKHTVYPGALELYKSLDSSYDPKEPSCNLIFMSARPHFYKSATEDHSYHRFQALVEEDRMHTMPTLLPGELWRSVWAAVMQPCRKTRAWRRVGRFKHRTFRNFAQLYPEYDYVFCGDDGQGDLLAGQMMVCDAGDLQDAEGSDSEEETEGSAESVPSAETFGDDLPKPHVRAVLIHHVMPEEGVLALEPPEKRGQAWREHLRRRHLYFFETYVGAAAALYDADAGLISAKCLREVADDAARNFEADVSYHEHEKGGFKWGPFEVKLRDDLARASELLVSAGLGAIPELAATTTLASAVLRQNSRQGCFSTPGDMESGDSRESENSEESKLLEE